MVLKQKKRFFLATGFDACFAGTTTDSARRELRGYD